MSGSNDFSVRLRERLAAAHVSRADRLQNNECTMRELDVQAQRFAQVASDVHRTVVRPLVEELAAQFDNATTEHYQTPLAVSSTCHFAPTDRIPARVRLLVGIGHDGRGGGALTYDLEIVPLLLSCEKNDSWPIDLSGPDEPGLRQRLEAWLLRFLETYLQLETDPRYQEWHWHTDPVCSMRISGANTVGTLEHGKRRYYFCSETCRQRFAAEPALYAPS
jgi:YHS domain-containing protein